MAITEDLVRGKLLSLADQLDLLRRYNVQYWEGRLTEEQLTAIDTSSEHTQQIDDLESLHVQFDSLEETVEMWWRVYVGEQSGSWRWSELRLDAGHLRLLDSNVKTYEPGIHRIRINLIAHWEPEDGRTLEEVRTQAKVSGEILAQLEVMSVYGLHSKLFREQDGRNLPYSDMPGTGVIVPDCSEPYALYFFWSPFDYKTRLTAHRVDSRRCWAAAPVLIES